MSIACKMKLTGYEDAGYHTPLGFPVTVQINPASIRIQKGISYGADKTLGG